MSKLFSKSFYIDTLYRLRSFIVFSIVYFTVSASFTPIGFIIQLIEGTPAIGGMQQIVLQPAQALGITPFSVIFVPIMTVMAFSFLFKRNTADFFEHLPYTRLQMSFSALLAVMSASVVIIISATLIPSLLLIPSVSAGLVKYSFVSGIPFALAQLVTVFYTMSVAFVGVSVAGTFLGASITTVSIILIPRFIMSMTTILLEMLSPTLVEGHSIPLFNNSYNLATTLIIDKTTVLATPVAYIYTLILGAALLALGIYLYKKRRSESATRMFAFTAALEIIRTSATAALALCAISLIYTELWIVAVFLLGMSVLVHFAFGRSLGREARSTRRTLITLAVAVGAAVIIFLSTLIGSVAVNSYSPEADEISAISLARELSFGQTYINYPDYVELRVSDVEITDGEVKKIVAKALDRGVPANYFDYNAFPVRIKSGLIARYRLLYLTDDEQATLNASYSDLSSYKDIWLSVGEGAFNPYIYVNGEPIETEKVEAVLETYKAEVAAMGYDAYIAAYSSEWAYTLCYSVIHDGAELIVNLPIFETLPETYALTERYAKEVEERVYNELISRLDAAVTSEKIHYLSLDYYGEEEMYYTFIEIGRHNSESAEIVENVKSFITPEMTYDKGATIFVSIYTDDLDDYGVSGSFLINSDISEEVILSFLKKYEY